MKATMSLIVLLLFSIVCQAQTIEETLAQIEATKLELAQNEQLVEQKIAELRESNPLFAPQDPFESDFEYLARLSQASPQLKRIRNQYLDEVRMRMDKLRSMTWETADISVTFGNYDANSQIWDISIQHNGHQKEKYEFQLSVPRTTAKTIYDNQANIITKGTLSLDPGNRIALSSILVMDPITSLFLRKEFRHIYSYLGSIR